MWALIALAAACLLLAQTAPAQAGPAELAKARKAFKEGEVQYRLGNFAGALSRYQEALKWAARPSILFNMAQCYRVMKNPDKALFYYRLYLDDWRKQNPQNPRPHNVKEVELRISDLRAQIKTKEAAREAARERAERQRQAREQELWRKKTLDRAGRSEPGGQGRIKLIGIGAAGSEVRVDGALMVVTEEGVLKAKEGDRQLRVSSPGFRPWTGRATVKAGATVNVMVSLVPLKKKLKSGWLVASIACLALAGGAEAMGIVFSQRANTHFADTEPFEDDSRLSYLGHGLAGAFGAAAVATLIIYLASGTRGEAKTSSVMVLPGGPGLTGQLTF